MGALSTISITPECPLTCVPLLHFHFTLRAKWHVQPRRPGRSPESSTNTPPKVQYLGFTDISEPVDSIQLNCKVALVCLLPAPGVIYLSIHSCSFQSSRGSYLGIFPIRSSREGGFFDHFAKQHTVFWMGIRTRIRLESDGIN